MDLLKAIFLGIVQGLSEFLPISSSGHLVIAQHILDFQGTGIAFEVFVHFGTLLSVLLVFRRDMVQMVLSLPALLKLKSGKLPEQRREYARFDLMIIVGSIPAAAIGLFFKDNIENLFDRPFLSLIMLFLTGLILWSSRYTRKRHDKVKGMPAFIIGWAQAFAIIPGISRSGSTIVCALWLGIRRDLAARFSFILSAPVILGATLVKLKDLLEFPLPQRELENLLIASIASAVSGYFAIVWLLEVIRKKKLEWFGLYCIAVSITGLSLYYLV